MLTAETIRQRLRPQALYARFGTAKAVPMQNANYAVSFEPWNLLYNGE
jgi:hypothetical protein